MCFDDLEIAGTLVPAKVDLTVSETLIIEEIYEC
jgi:hypothetical protein